MFCSSTVLPALRRRDDQAALAHADGAEHVDDARRHLRRLVLELELLGRVERREVVEEDPLACRLGERVDEVDLVDLLQREEALALAGAGGSGP